MRLIVGSYSLLVFVLVSARPNAPSTSTGVDDDGAKANPVNIITNRYREHLALNHVPRALRNSKINKLNNKFSDQTHWLPISSSSQTKNKIKTVNSTNMFNYTNITAGTLFEQSPAKSNLDGLNVNKVNISSNIIKTNALGLNVVGTKKYTQNKNYIMNLENPFEKNQILNGDSDLVESFINNSLPDLKSQPNNPIVNPMSSIFKNQSSNKYFGNNNDDPQWNPHKNSYIIVEDVDPSYLPKPPPPPQPPWYESHKPPPIPTPEPTSIIFHSEITYYSPEPMPEQGLPKPVSSPEYTYTPIPKPENHLSFPEPYPEFNYPYPSNKPQESVSSQPEMNYLEYQTNGKPTKPIYDDPVFVEPNTPIFITPISVTTIQNSPLNPIVTTNGKPPPSIVVLDDLTIPSNDSPSPVGSGLDATLGTTLTGTAVLGDPGAASSSAGSTASAGSSSGGGVGIGTAGAAAAAAAASSAALGTSVIGGTVGTAISGSATMCNNIQVNNFNRQGIQCPPVNINVLDSGSVDQSVLDDDPQVPADPPVQQIADVPASDDVTVESFSLFEYFSSIFGAINVLNPVGFTFWALMFAPLSILVTSGLGAVAFFFPWLFPRFWLRRSFRNIRSLHNDSDLFLLLNNTSNLEFEYLEKLSHLVETPPEKNKSFKQRRRKR